MTTEIMKHLRSRHLYKDTHGYSIYIDDNNKIATFNMFTIDGIYCGYTQYRPNGSKTARNSQADGKYYTYKTKDYTSFWGTESLYMKTPLIVITEGIFSACRFHNYGIPALAVMSNNPKKYLSQIELLNRKTLSVCDPDKAGRMLSKYTDFSIFLMENDVDDLSNVEMDDLITLIEGLYIVKL